MALWVGHPNLDQDIVELGLFNRLVQEGSEIDLGGLDT